jgi:hypothetical protein
VKTSIPRPATISPDGSRASGPGIRPTVSRLLPEDDDAAVSGVDPLDHLDLQVG